MQDEVASKKDRKNVNVHEWFSAIDVNQSWQGTKGNEVAKEVGTSNHTDLGFRLTMEIQLVIPVFYKLWIPIQIFYNSKLFVNLVFRVVLAELLRFAFNPAILSTNAFIFGNSLTQMSIP